MNRVPRRSRDGERGAVIIWLALFLFLLLGFTALGVDIGKMMTTHTQLQNAADAAALAGASAIDFRTGSIEQMTAVARAESIAVKDRAFELQAEPVVVDPSDVTFPGNNKVTVVARRAGSHSMVTHFLQVLGVPTIAVTATATAKADTASIVSCGVVPLGLSAPSDDGFETGVVYSLRDNSGGSDGGNYGGLDFPVCDHGECPGGPTTGASKWSCLLEHGYCCELKVGQTLTTEPGVKQGPFREGINSRFDDDTDSREGISYSDYHGNYRRIIYVPITTSLAGNGRTSATVLSFGAFFLRNRVNGSTGSTLSGEFINAVVPGRAGSTNPAGPVTYTLRLVQ